MEFTLELNLQEVQLALLIVADWQIEKITEVACDSMRSRFIKLVSADPDRQWRVSHYDEEQAVKSYPDDSETTAYVQCGCIATSPDRPTVNFAVVKRSILGDERIDVHEDPTTRWNDEQSDWKWANHYRPPCMPRVDGHEGQAECDCCWPDFTAEATWNLSDYHRSDSKPLLNLPDLYAPRGRSILRQILLDLESRLWGGPVNYLGLYNRDLITVDED